MVKFRAASIASLNDTTRGAHFEPETSKAFTIYEFREKKDREEDDFDEEEEERAVEREWEVLKNVLRIVCICCRFCSKVIADSAKG